MNLAHFWRPPIGHTIDVYDNYSKSNLCDILLFGEKPHLSEKYQHNKLISYAVQTFLCRTKRLYFDEENKPHNQVLAIPENHADP